MSSHIIDYTDTPRPVLPHKLVDKKTGEEITLPARRICWDGAEIIVRDFKPSRFEGNEGYIYTTMNETFVPSVVGAKIVPVVS